MPVYNAGRFLPAALDSILEQTFTDFELIAVNDGSTDESGKVLAAYASRDSRLRVVTHRQNQGLVATLNEAIDLAKGAYLARQDGDDISFPTRFEQEVGVLDQHPDVVLVAGSFEVFDEQDEFIYREVLPTEDEDIKRAMYLRNPIGHGSVMFRKDACIQVGKYSPDCGPTEDYELWSRLAKVGKFHALETATFRWRVNTRGITRSKNDLLVSIMKQHLTRRWTDTPPPVLSRRKLYARGLYYYRTYPKRGVDMKNVVLADNAQLATKLIRRGRPLAGLHQLLAVLFVGRSGVRAVLYRLHILRKGAADLIRQRARTG